MQQHKTSQLYEKHAAVDFYQERYAHGYMDEWPDDKKQRIFEIIRELELPDTGEAIDFGCGNGVLTAVLREALPIGWNVYGTDISEIAIQNAKRRYPGCIYFVAGEREFAGKRFDLLFTHHVLEHVYDLAHVLVEINDHLKDESTTLHILPCGNEHSFEHGICLLRKDGINPKLENRFFFEDEGHVRRLNTEQLSALCKAKAFLLVREYYSNHFYGAINWITQSGPGFIQLFTNASSALDGHAKRELSQWRFRLLFLSVLRYPAAFVESRLHRKTRTVRDFMFLTVALPFYVFAKPMDAYLKSRACSEWRKRQTERNGSEMYLVFKRVRFA